MGAVAAVQLLGNDIIVTAGKNLSDDALSSSLLLLCLQPLPLLLFFIQVSSVLTPGRCLPLAGRAAAEGGASTASLLPPPFVLLVGLVRPPKPALVQGIGTGLLLFPVLFLSPSVWGRWWWWVAASRTVWAVTIEETLEGAVQAVAEMTVLVLDGPVDGALGGVPIWGFPIRDSYGGKFGGCAV